jgi:hypothetical protein
MFSRHRRQDGGGAFAKRRSPGLLSTSKKAGAFNAFASLPARMPALKFYFFFGSPL